MSEPTQPENETITSKQAIRERQKTARRVYLDPSSPSVRSIVRVVVITLLLLTVAGFFQTIILSLAYLAFLIFLSVFFAYLVDPLVKMIRYPFLSSARDLPA